MRIGDENPYYRDARKLEQGLLAHEAVRSNAGDPIEGCERATFNSALAAARYALKSAKNNGLWHTIVWTPLMVARADKSFSTYFERYMKNRQPAGPASPPQASTRKPTEAEWLRLGVIARDQQPLGPAAHVIRERARELHREQLALVDMGAMERISNADRILRFDRELRRFYADNPSLQP